MSRQTRIQLVTGLAIFFFGLFVACVLPGIVAVLLFKDLPAGMDQLDQVMIEQLAAMNRVAAVNRTLFVVGAGLAAGALLYSLIVLAAWFVGSREMSQANPENRP
jgi:hypothetical protein